MKNSQVSVLIFLTMGLLQGACKKELNVFPTTSEVDGNLITDQQTAQTVLNGVYYQFASAGTDGDNIPNTFWASIHEIIPSELSGSLVNPYGVVPLDTVDLLPNGNDNPYIWAYDYTLVNAANGFIRNVAPVANIPAPAKQQMLAEAKFLRAFGNSQLLLYYGQYNDPSSKYGIILRDTFVTAANINLPRSSVAAAYTSILSDLDAAIHGLPTLNSGIYYANASAAKLLKARVLMNRGMAGDYAQVISLTNDIITNGPFALEDSLKDIFLTKGLNSREVILGIQPYSNEDYKFYEYLELIQFVATDSLASLLANDSRSKWECRSAYNYRLNGFSNLLTKYYSGDLTNVVQTPLSVYSYAFRLTEAYLLEAEAITLLNGDLTSAKTLLTTVMSHAGAGAPELAAVADAETPAALQLEIIKENMRNFAYENGVDWLALRRLPFAAIQRLNPQIRNVRQLILPIPPNELNYNNVFQNPGY